MLLRLLMPLLMLMLPRVIPRLIRSAVLVWRLMWDRRVPLLLRLLMPGSLLYFLTPLARVPLPGLIGYVVVLSVVVFLLLNLAPRDVVESHAPWRARRRASDPGERDPSKVVEGSYRLVDEEEPTK